MSDRWLGPLHAIWDDWPKHRKNFCRGMDPERFLADIHGYGWTPAMIDELEAEVRRRCAAERDVPVVEHMLDAAIAVRHGSDIRHQECRSGYGVVSPRIPEITDADEDGGAGRAVPGHGLDH